MSRRVPEKVSVDGLEDRLSRSWDDAELYRFDRTATRDNVYSIDTPPPTASGSLHIGHVFSYTQFDLMARYKRMQGFSVFHPIGWDDNGLPTERRVQNYYGVSCDPTIAYDSAFAPPAEPDPKKRIAISRRNFIDLCAVLTAEDEKAYLELFRRLGMSFDWATEYTTIGDAARRCSQRGFLRMLAGDNAYTADAPTLWDVDFQTAVAQAEIEDREQNAAYHRIAFHKADGSGDIHIETTRPELLAACVALVANPDDPRYQPFFGTNVVTPIFGATVPIVAHPLADPEKGSGIAMICTFGDVTDVIWWRELSLPMRTILGRNGRLLNETPDDVDAAAYAQIAGLTAKQAQRKVVELLTESGELVGDPKPISHPVKFYEKGDRPLEIVSSRQWYFRNGAKDPELKAELLARGQELVWHPSHMATRYEHWVNGLTTDWLISRQRFFGVPIPVWYPVLFDGSTDYEHPIAPPESALPVDPMGEAPEGFDESQRGVPGGFVGDPDIMDTWATSSLTPHIAGHWEDDPDLFSRVFPYDMRPQAHEIIRTWLFSSVLRAHVEHDSLPWRHAAISGWILDPDRKKMSKSKGNVVTPMGLLEKHGSDAVRYWASSARLGVDTSFSEAQMEVGRRLSIKLMNVARFVLSFPAAPEGAIITQPLDRSLAAALADTVQRATASFERYDAAGALEATERFFWNFCDNYVELVKTRAYANAETTASALATLELALDSLTRLFAPFLPFAADEVWSWWHDGSVHTTDWPVADDIRSLAPDGNAEVLTAAAQVLGEIRKAKTSEKKSQRAGVAKCVVHAPAETLAYVEASHADLRDAGSIQDFVLNIADGDVMVETTLADD